MFFQGNEKYNCATYLRLSRSDGDQQESNSIKNQRALLNDYMGKHPELHKFDEYVDDGYSGTNFERPDFKRMMQDIEKRNVNCIIVKDLSRFGRNYIETGRYLERIFPFMGVRFIAINDHYDSAEENDDKGRILIPFNNLINDTYCRDISMRVRSHLDPPVGVKFEADNIYTLDSNGRMILTILASVAEEESHSKSIIMNWSIDRRFSRGLFLTPALLGFILFIINVRSIA